ncbi:MAG: ThiS family protein [Methanocella sp. PtaU1.Bin125]|nr:MAG: ThiS family protein [Methanocella sp. PtaU1.Bin125]
MRVRVYSGRTEDREVDLPEGGNYYDLLASLKINPETVVVFRDGVPVSFDAKVAAGSAIEVMRVVSGG